MKHSSDILLHFVDRAHREDPVVQAETCLAILREGFRFSDQALNFGMSIGGAPIGLTVKAVCFTDVPLRMAENHAARYGKLAIGVRKSLVKRWGGNPVLYLVDKLSTDAAFSDGGKRKDLRGVFGGLVADKFRALVQTGERLRLEGVPEGHWMLALNDDQRKAMIQELGWVFLSHTKDMFDLGGDVDGEDDTGARRDRYYMEREWRVCLSGSHEKTAEPGGSGLVVKKGGYYYLPMAREDARVIVVPNDRVRTTVTETLLRESWSPSQLPTMITFDDSRDL